MTHLSEDTKRLTIEQVSIEDAGTLLKMAGEFNDACLIILPAGSPTDYSNRLDAVETLLSDFASRLGPEATLIVMGEVIDLVKAHVAISPAARYQTWIAIEQTTAKIVEGSRLLPQQHFGALVHTRYQPSLRHTKTRLAYTYCPACDKTTKDYGGKKHIYHEYGTLISDVWRDLQCDLGGDLIPVIDRFADLFGVEPYQKLLVLDCRSFFKKRSPVVPDKPVANGHLNKLSTNRVNTVKLGDSLEELHKLPDNSVDFAFADPPYNLGKHYKDYTDDLEIKEYFDWCDKWIAEIARVLRPGRTCALLNIPLWAIRHFLFMETILEFQNWIVWDALSFPVRMIMPAHYTILCFSKGTSRELPGLTGEAGQTDGVSAPEVFHPLKPLADGFCLRATCIASRKMMRVEDRGPLTDIWSDMHRLKHNSRRVDHPTQLPPHLMYRLISIFTKPGELVLDPFNGSGTTTLTAHQLKRNYFGIEIAKKYYDLAQSRHQEIAEGLDPFRKEERVLTAKNSPVPRLRKQKYDVSKKALQLEVKRISKKLKRLPTRDEVIRLGRYPIKYYDDYFASWGEVCAAARTTGMSENKQSIKQLDFLEAGEEVISAS